MGLTLFLADNQARRSHLIARAIAADLQSTQAYIYLIVPEQFTLQAEQTMMDALAAPGFMQLRIMSPSRLIQEVFDRTRRPGRAIIDDRGLAMTFKHITQQCRGDLLAYGRIAHYPGFSQKFLAFMARMKQCDITPAMLRDAAGGGALTQAKLHDLALLYEQMDAYLQSRQYMDSADQLGLFIDTLPADGVLPDSRVYFDGFSYFTPRECRMVSQLMAIGAQVGVSLGNGEGPLFSPMQTLRRRLEDSSRELGVDLRRVVDRPDADTAGYTRAVSCAFGYSNLQADAAMQGRVVAVSATAREDEIEACAAYICRTIRNEKAAFSDFSIALNDLDTYCADIERIFARYEIPCFIDKTRRTGHNPVLRYLVCVLRAAAYDCAQNDMLTLAKTGLFGLSAADVEALQAYCMQFDLHGQRRWSRDFTYGAAEYDLAAINRSRAALMGPVSIARRGLQNGLRPGHEWADVLYNVISHVDSREKLESMAETLQAAGHADEAALCLRVWGMLMDMLSQWNELFADAPLSAIQALEILEECLSQSQAGILPTSADVVTVGDISRSKHVEIPYLIVLGAQNGSLWGISQDESILTDSEMSLLAQSGVQLDQASPFLTAQKQYDLYNLFSSCTGQMYLSWCSKDDSGEDIPMDYLAGRLAALAGLQGSYAARRLFVRPVQHQGSAGLLAPLLRQAAAGVALSPELKTMISWYAGGEYSAFTRRMALAAAGSPPDETVEDMPLSPDVVSVTQLEGYMACPRSYALTHLLRPTPLEEHGIDPMAAGNFLHAAMEAFSARVFALGQPYDALNESDALTIMEQVSDKLAEEFEYGLLKRSYTLRWSAVMMKQVLNRAAGTWLTQMQRGAFVPVGYEMRFGRGGLPAANIARGGPEAYLQGRIDRVDVLRRDDADYLRIIDYKSGSAGIDVTDAVNGLSIQTWLYLYALEKVFPQPNGSPVKAAGAYIFPLQNPWLDQSGDPDALRREKLRLQGWCLEDSDIQAAMDRDLPGKGTSDVISVKKRGDAGLMPEKKAHAVMNLVAQNAAQAVGAIRAGELSPRPWRKGTDTACDRCAWRSGCQWGLYLPGQARTLLSREKAQELVERSVHDEPTVE